MTAILIFIILVVTGFMLFRKMDKFYFKQTGHGSKEFHLWPFLKLLVVPVVFLILAIIQPFSIERVDSSGVGLKVSLVGSKRGIGDYKYASGYVMVNNWIETFKEFPLNQQHVMYTEQEVFAKGGFPLTIKPTLNYSLKRYSVGDMYMNLRLDLRDLEQGWLQTAIVGSVNDVVNRWEIDSIFNNRESFESQIQAECNKRLKKWFEISQLRTNLLPPESLKDAIVAKTRAIQEAQAEDQKALTAEAEARRKIAQAKGDSAQAVIAASGEAKAIQLKQQQITPVYVDYVKWSRANSDVPRVPSTILGSSTGVILNR